MTETILALLVAIRAVESTDGLDARAHGNNYQITSVCVWDVNRIYHTRYRWPEDTRDEQKARDIATLYLTHYGREWLREFGRVPTQSDLARIYNRGYEGAKRGEGHGYAAKVRKAQTATKRNRFNAKKRKDWRAK